jgi:putative transposase
MEVCPGRYILLQASLRLEKLLSGWAAIRIPELAGLVVATLQRGLDKGLYDLRTFVVMSNHVHILLRPQQRASRLLQWLKGTTARDANQMLTRTGKPFWQRESYDHWVRDGQGLERVAAYIESNPVKAGITAERSQYRWSSAWGTAN